MSRVWRIHFVGHAPVDREAHELEPEAAAANLVEHVDVGEIRHGMRPRRPGEAACDRRRIEARRAAVRSARPSCASRPGPVVRQERVHGARSTRSGRRRARTRREQRSTRILPTAARLRYRRGVSRIGIMLGVALPLAAADLVVKASEPTEPWAYHERSLGWLLLSLSLLARNDGRHPDSVAGRRSRCRRSRRRPARQLLLGRLERHGGAEPARPRRRPRS